MTEGERRRMIKLVPDPPMDPDYVETYAKLFREAMARGDLLIKGEIVIPTTSPNATGGSMYYPQQSADELLRIRLSQRKIDEEIERKERMVEEYGQDTYGNEYVFKFRKRLGETTYTYVALKINDRWYTTGQTRGAYKWDELVLFLVSGDDPVPFSGLIELAEIS